MPTKFKRSILPDVDHLRSVFCYDPETGALTWKIKPRGRGKIGHLVGGFTPMGYRQVVLDHQHFLAHRVIWKMQTGMEPPENIDHKDGDVSNDRWENLREATVSDNMCNAARRIDNTSGVKGVSFDKNRGLWRAYVIHHQKQHEGGRHHCFGRAIKAMRVLRLSLHGDFARVA